MKKDITKHVCRGISGLTQRKANKTIMALIKVIYNQP
jgi:hypothetical protein